ncbi:hypothetical protein TRVL_00425 [Trypanosoma vivax]|nr:hypothetical protein TRVL_00425 [Trypanosoma vivax]
MKLLSVYLALHGCTGSGFAVGSLLRHGTMPHDTLTLLFLFYLPACEPSHSYKESRLWTSRSVNKERRNYLFDCTVWDLVVPAVCVGCALSLWAAFCPFCFSIGHRIAW